MIHENLNIVFAGTPDFAAIQLHMLCQKGFSISGVFTQPDRPQGRGQQAAPSAVKIVSLEHNIPVFQPASFKKREARHMLKALKPDILIVAAYGLLLPQTVLDIPTLGCINVHASLLPRWRGASPIQHSILAGDSKTGITIMQMTAGMDEGPALYQLECDITSEDTSQTLHDKLADLGCKALATVLSDLRHYQAQAQPQSPSNVTYAPKIQKQNACIQWSQQALEIERAIRAFQPWPVCYSTLNDKNIRFWQATALPSQGSAKPGTIVEVSAQAIFVATGKGILEVTHMQLPGKPTMTWSDMRNGHAALFKVGCVFE